MTDTRDWTTPNGPAPNERHDSGRDLETGWMPSLERVEGNVAIPREIFEKIYLNPPVNVNGDFRNIFANPTPLGLVGFLVSALPVSFQLMGLAGAGTGGIATNGFSIYFGGVLQFIACFMEWVLGNTFSFLVFGSFGAAWFALAGVADVHASWMKGTMLEPEKAEAVFNASFAWGLLTLGLLILTFSFFALRTNIVFVTAFAVVSIGIFLFAGASFALANGQTSLAGDLQKAVGAIFFFGCVCGWYLLVANLLEVLEFGFELPVGDLSGRLSGLGRMPKYRDRSKSV